MMQIHSVTTSIIHEQQSFFMEVFFHLRYEALMKPVLYQHLRNPGLGIVHPEDRQGVFISVLESPGIC